MSDRIIADFLRSRLHFLVSVRSLIRRFLSAVFIGAVGKSRLARKAIPVCAATAAMSDRIIADLLRSRRLHYLVFV